MSATPGAWRRRAAARERPEDRTPRSPVLVWPNHPVPGTESPHSSISCPSQRGGRQLPATRRPLPSVLPVHPSCPGHVPAAQQVCAPLPGASGVLLVQVPAAHWYVVSEAPRRGKGQQRDPTITGEEKCPGSHSRTCSGSRRKQGPRPVVSQGASARSPGAGSPGSTHDVDHEHSACPWDTKRGARPPRAMWRTHKPRHGL